MDDQWRTRRDIQERLARDRGFHPADDQTRAELKRQVDAGWVQTTRGLAFQSPSFYRRTPPEGDRHG